MSKMTMTAILAAMMAVSMPAAYAQTTATAPTHAAATSGDQQMRPDQIRASKFVGSTVYDVNNQNIGSVKDIIFDRDGKIDAVVVDVGAFLGMGGKYVAIKLNDIKTDNNRLTVDMSKDQLKQAQEFKFPDTNSFGMATPATNTGSSTAPATSPADRNTTAR